MLVSVFIEILYPYCNWGLGYCSLIRWSFSYVVRHLLPYHIEIVTRGRLVFMPLSGPYLLEDGHHSRENGYVIGPPLVR